MKKILATGLSLSILVGCSSPSNKTVDLNAVGQGLGTLSDAPAMMQITGSDVESFFGLKSSDYTTAVCSIPLMNVTATEIVLFGYENDTQKNAIVAALDARLANLENTWSQYLPDQYELVKKRTMVDSNGVYGYIIGESGLVQEVQALIQENTK